MSSGFISETELAEKRRVRQEEWDKVRKPDQPEEAPEEEYDHRSLYERLQAQKQKRDLEYEEAHRLKNMIKGLDDDEVEFLDLVDRSKLEEERKKSAEEAREMAEFRSKVATLQEESIAERIQLEIQRPPLQPPSTNSSRSSQSKLLAGAVVKKRSASSTETSADASDPGPTHAKVPKLQTDNETEVQAKSPNSQKDTQSKDSSTSKKQFKEIKCDKLVKVGSMTCIGVLPGLGHYHSESSDEIDSDDSSDLDSLADHSVTSPNISRFDLVGRKIKKKTCEAAE